MKESESIKDLNAITKKIIGAAIEVHRNMGAGLFESIYEKCLCYELTLRGVRFARQIYMPVVYKDKVFDFGFRADLLVENQVIVELKSTNEMSPLHEAQLLNYLRLAKLRLGLLINFNNPVLKNGIKRMLLG